jgi:hypothetical protein
MRHATRVAGAVALALAVFSLAGCLTAAPPEDQRSWGHAAWCGTSPPSGYCIVDDHR